MLDNHVIGIYHVTSALDCGTRCLSHIRCLSFNYKSINNEAHECQLNDANRLICPECYHAEHDVVYYDDAKVRTQFIRLVTTQHNCQQLSQQKIYRPDCKTVSQYVSQLGQFAKKKVNCVLNNFDNKQTLKSHAHC